MNKSYWIAFAFLSIGYFVAGKAALLLAIPPGYATAIWPSAGLALAVLYVRGAKLWPAVVLGSAAVNTDLAALAQEGWGALAVPLLIGLGAALQALVGREAVLRSVGSPLRLDDVRSVLIFVFVAGGVASTISATVGIGALVATGKMAMESAPYNWFTWWVGDGLGVMIFATLIFVYVGEPKALWLSRRRVLPPALCITALVMVAIYVVGSRWEQDRQQAEFDRLSVQVYQRIQDHFDRYMDSLRAVKGLFETSHYITREEFRHFSSDIIERQSGFQGLAFNRVVHSDQRPEFERQLSEALGETRVITQRDNNGVLVAASPRRDYVAIDYLEPLSGNRAAYGYDISSAASPRRALIAAEARNGPAATDPLRLVQETESRLGVAVYLPVRRRLEGDGPVRLVGYVAGVFRLHDLMMAVVPENTLQGMQLEVWQHSDGEDNGSTGQRLFIRGKPSGENGADIRLNFSNSWPVTFADRHWHLVVGANSRFELSAQSIMPWAVLATGMLFTGLVGMTLLVLTGQYFRAREVGRELNRRIIELKETQEQLIESEKMASMSGLVAGFAHELNTPLGVALTAETTLARSLEDLEEQVEEESARGLVGRMREASQMSLSNIQRAAKLVTNFKAMAVDKDDAEVSEIDLCEYLHSFYQHTETRAQDLGHRVSLNCPNGLRVRTVVRGLTQVIANLLENSLTHAFSEYQQGHIELSAEAVGDDVVIRVADDGVGIGDEALGKVFEPFYTTRRGKGGTGLGLHLVYNIVHHQLGGRVRVISGSARRGCCVEVVIPRAASGAPGH
ncbi:CHASE domain-containing protein [Spongiibacter nanhainus]|uniref:histidine kinase n=1 Tax=Spongiibacter nanhainus TaxID=2794344 RepID=A0A7T4R350_9GAMM|nr:CHASE domain-containing protein [Spongiibacter nanhainus]QQD19614.1 CHASE domain-containing protein [Spongiibacter nanhainus]